jgi:hypothetical protein
MKFLFDGAIDPGKKPETPLRGLFTRKCRLKGREKAIKL